MEKKDCSCNASQKMVMACSGASDLGHISDIVARKLRDNSVRKMNCLAVVGAGIEKSIEDFKTKDILVIDGCPVDCGKKIMERNGLTDYKYLRITDLGFEKGKTPAIESNVNLIYEKAEAI